MGHCAKQPGYRAIEPRRAGERHNAAGGGHRSLRRGAAGVDSRTLAVQMGDHPDQPRQRTFKVGRAREWHQTAGEGCRSLSCGPAGVDARASLPVRVGGRREALRLYAACPYALGAAVFGPEREARRFAGEIRAGSVVINDLVVPTADPRLPFGGRGESGYGVTRGAEGLLALTAIKATSVRRGRFRPHFQPPDADQLRLAEAYLGVAHGAGLRPRLGAALALVSALRRAARDRSSAS